MPKNTKLNQPKRIFIMTVRLYAYLPKIHNAAHHLDLFSSGLSTKNFMYGKQHITFRSSVFFLSCLLVSMKKNKFGAIANVFHCAHKLTHSHIRTITKPTITLI